MVDVRKDAAYETRWKAALARLFPDGLTPLAVGDARPSRGVVVTKDSRTSRAAGLQAGDIIVGLEGWRVDNLRQYYAINAFFTRDDA